MPRKTIRLGIIGTGGMAHAHALNYAEIPGVRVAACCDLDEARCAAFARQFSIPHTYTDFRAMLKKEPLDAVANVTHDRVHARIALAVVRAGLSILSEKPLAATYAEGRRMAAAVRKNPVVNMVNFSYRNSAALHEAARLVRGGRIGRVMHVESSYLQSWLTSRAWGDWRKEPGWLWRLSTNHGSLGVLGDIGCHLYDATALLAGPFASIQCRLKTFDKKVPGNRVGDYRLDANDSFVTTATFRDGGLGTMHASRWATGQANSLRFRVYGDRGAVEVDLDRSFTTYRVCRGRKNVDAFRWEEVEAKPVPNLYQRFVRAVRSGRADACDFANALRVQACMHYSMQSHQRGTALRLPHVGK